MIELASDLERREGILLETAHIKSATKALTAVKVAMDREHAKEPSTPKAMKIIGDRSLSTKYLMRRLG